MKKIILLAAFFALIFTFKAEAKAPAYFEFGIFYSSLSPHGTWLELEPGFVVWRPTIMQRWSPYRSGRWIWTEYGWYWDSYEPFGHITYHYGRWYYDDYYGWIWIPDYEWAPAWVEWRYDDDYIGWAPLPPYATFSVSVGIVFTNSYHTPYNHWHFVNYDRFCDPYPYNYYIADKHKHRIHSRTKYRSDYDYRNGGVYNRGIDVDFVRQRSGREVNSREIVRVNDEREFRNRGERNDDKIRTFAVSREDLRNDRDGLRDVKVERSDRKSSLLTSKVEIGDRGTNSRNEVRKDDKTPVRNNDVTVNNRNRDDNKKVQTNNERKEPAVDRNKTPQVRSKNNDQNISRQPEVKQNRQTVEKKTVNTSRNTELKKNQEVNRKQSPVVTNRQKTEVKPNFQQERQKQEVNRKQSPVLTNRQKTEVRPNFQQERQKQEVNRKQSPVVTNRQKTEVRPNVQQERQKQERVNSDNRNNTRKQVEIKRNNDRPANIERKSGDTNTRDKQRVERDNGSKRKR